MACPTQEEFELASQLLPTAGTYTLTVAGVTQPAQRTCFLSHRFPRQGPFTVWLTIAGPNAGSFTQEVVIKDHLIVSIGDSYGSGEGNPDIPGDYRRGVNGLTGPATLVPELRVTDAGGLVANDTVTVRVKAPGAK